MSNTDEERCSAVRKELSYRANELSDRRGKVLDSYGGRSRPHVMVEINGIEIHRNDFGMSVYVSNRPIYSEIRDGRCTYFDQIKIEEVVAKLQKMFVLDDLTNLGQSRNPESP